MHKIYQDDGFLDPEKFGSNVPDKSRAHANYDTLGAPRLKDTLKIRDMLETATAKRAAKKVSGVHDIKMLERLDDAKKFESPANVVLARGI